MADVFTQRSAAAEAEAERAERLTRRPDDRVVEELRLLRAWTFWGPFWAIIATGVVGAVLYLAAVNTVLPR